MQIAVKIFKNLVKILLKNNLKKYKKIYQKNKKIKQINNQKIRTVFQKNFKKFYRHLKVIIKNLKNNCKMNKKKNKNQMLKGKQNFKRVLQENLLEVVCIKNHHSIAIFIQISFHSLLLFLLRKNNKHNQLAYLKLIMKILEI